MELNASDRGVRTEERKRSKALSGDRISQHNLIQNILLDQLVFALLLQATLQLLFKLTHLTTVFRIQTYTLIIHRITVFFRYSKGSSLIEPGVTPSSNITI